MELLVIRILCEIKCSKCERCLTGIPWLGPTLASAAQIILCHTYNLLSKTKKSGRKEFYKNKLTANLKQESPWQADSPWQQQQVNQLVSKFLERSLVLLGVSSVLKNVFGADGLTVIRLAGQFDVTSADPGSSLVFEECGARNPSWSTATSCNQAPRTWPLPARCGGAR